MLDDAQVYFTESAHVGVHFAAVSFDDLRFVRFVRVSTGTRRARGLPRLGEAVVLVVTQSALDGICLLYTSDAADE